MKNSIFGLILLAFMTVLASAQHAQVGVPGSILVFPLTQTDYSNTAKDDILALQNTSSTDTVTPWVYFVESSNSQFGGSLTSTSI